MRTRQVITALVLALTLGLHWAALQSVAWVSMIVRYSQDATLSEAIAQTFDGRHPCALCRIVDAGQKSDENSEGDPLPSRTVLKIDLLCEASRAFLFTHLPFPPFELRAQSGLERFERPPSPPPRRV